MVYSILAQASSYNEHIPHEGAAGTAKANGKMIGLPALPGKEGYGGRFLAIIDGEPVKGLWQTEDPARLEVHPLDEAAIAAAVEFPIGSLLHSVAIERG